MEPIEEKILEVLSYYGRPDLAGLLRNVIYYRLEHTTSFGGAAGAYRAGVFLYSDIVTHERIESLEEGDRNTILKAFRILYPLEPGGIDVSWIESVIDPSADVPVGSNIETGLSTIGFEYLNEQLAKCDRKILEHDFDGAATNARTLIETLLKFILDKYETEYGQSEDLPSLYKRVTTSLSLNPKKQEDIGLKQILSGLFSIVQGIASVRNAVSDAHGRSTKGGADVFLD